MILALLFVYPSEVRLCLYYMLDLYTPQVSLAQGTSVKGGSAGGLDLEESLQPPAK